MILDYFLSGVSETFILQCNFDTRKLPIYLHVFYKECLDAWAMLNEVSVLSYEDVVNQIIWNNKNITIGKASIFDKKVMRKGIVTIGDLLSDTGVFLKSVNVLNAKLSPVAFFKLIGIVDAIPSEWRLIIKQSTQHPCSHLSDKINLNIDNSETDLSKVSSRLLYNAFKKRKQVPPSAQKKMNEKFPELQVSWKEIYSLPFVVTIETKIREFQYKILNNIVFTNEKLFRLKMIDSSLYVFCKGEVESLEHLLFFCEVTKMFWRAFCTWLAECKIRIESLNISDVLFGVYKKGEDFKILNHLILSAKFYIYKCKLSGVNPSLQVFKVKTKVVHQIERKIAAKRDKLKKHNEKWRKLEPCVSK